MSYLRRSTIVDDRHLEAVFSLYNSYDNKQIDDALEEVGFGDRDLIDLNEAQLRKLKLYIKTDKDRQSRRIINTPAD